MTPKKKTVLRGLQRDIPWVSDAMLPSEQNPAQADILLCYIQPRSRTEPLIRESDVALPVSFIDTHFTKESGGANMPVAVWYYCQGKNPSFLKYNFVIKRNGAPNIKNHHTASVSSVGLQSMSMCPYTLTNTLFSKDPTPFSPIPMPFLVVCDYR